METIFSNNKTPHGPATLSPRLKLIVSLQKKISDPCLFYLRPWFFFLSNVQSINDFKDLWEPWNYEFDKAHRVKF